MTPRQVVDLALRGETPPYVPWNFGFCAEAKARLEAHLPEGGVDAHLGNHLLQLGNSLGFAEPIGDDRFRDIFGAVWDRSTETDIGIVEGQVLPDPTLDGYVFPDPEDPVFFADADRRIAEHPDRFRVHCIGFSLFERAWTLRGMESLMMDFYENPEFVDDLLNAIADFNIAQARHAMTRDIDAVYFGDDWGQQQGLIMGRPLWDRFIRPVLKRMYAAVHQGGCRVFIHSCGQVDSLFDELATLGVNCFNPFQPEVMDIWSLVPRYRGRLAFHGGLSTQQTLPYRGPDEVRDEARRLIELGADGGYIFAPAHDVPNDVPLDNMLAFIEVAQSQPAYDGPTAPIAEPS